MSKSKVMMAAVLLTGMVFTGQTMAAQIGIGVGGPKQPDPAEPEFGTFNATVKQRIKRVLPGGWVSDYQIFNVTDVTMYFCQDQVNTLMQGPNTTLEVGCHRVN